MSLKRNLLTLVSCTVLISGCSGRNLNDPQSWVPPVDVEKVTSDWDVAEAVCDKVALDTKLTQKESRLDKRSWYEEKDPTFESDPLIEGIAAGLMFMQMFNRSTAEENKKQQAFITCMQQLGWKEK